MRAYNTHVFELIVCHCFHYDKQKMQKINKYLLLGLCFVNSRINYSKAPRAPRAREINKCIYRDKTDVDAIVNLSLTCINPFRIILLLLPLSSRKRRAPFIWSALLTDFAATAAADIIFYAHRNCELFFVQFHFIPCLFVIVCASLRKRRAKENRGSCGCYRIIEVLKIDQRQWPFLTKLPLRKQYNTSKANKTKKINRDIITVE